MAEEPKRMPSAYESMSIANQTMFKVIAGSDINDDENAILMAQFLVNLSIAQSLYDIASELKRR